MQTILMSAEYDVLQPDVNTVDRIDISPTGPPHLRGKTTLNVTKSVSDRADGISTTIGSIRGVSEAAKSNRH